MLGGSSSITTLRSVVSPIVCEGTLSTRSRIRLSSSVNLGVKASQPSLVRRSRHPLFRRSDVASVAWHRWQPARPPRLAEEVQWQHVAAVGVCRYDHGHSRLVLLERSSAVEANRRAREDIVKQSRLVHVEYVGRVVTA